MSSKKSNIAKNTVFMYCRTFIAMAIGLYTSRITLLALGIEDYGIYNIIAGVVVMFSFIKNSLTSSTQRFFNYELGMGDQTKLNRIFSITLTNHICISTLLLLLGFLFCYPIVFKLLEIPKERLNSAFYVYLMSLLCMAVNVLRSPFDASIIAHEKMKFYAYLGIVEAISKLCIAYLLFVTNFDRLVFYAFLFLVHDIIYIVIFYTYSKFHFEECIIKLCFDSRLTRETLSFSGWSLIGSMTNLLAMSGVNILFNLFHGVFVNAAYGIANQVNNAVNNLVVGFKTAYTPQLVKLYAQKNYEQMHILVMQCSKIGFLLFFIPSILISFNADEILSIWLKEVPPYAASFCRIIMLCTLVDSTTTPYFHAIQATGHIKSYQLSISCSYLLDVLVSFIMLYQKVDLGLIFFSRFFTRGLINMFIGWYYMVKLLHFPLIRYLRTVILPIIIYLMIIVGLVLVMRFQFQNDSWISTVIMMLLTFVISTFGCFFVFSKSERSFVLKMVRTKLSI